MSDLGNWGGPFAGTQQVPFFTASEDVVFGGGSGGGGKSLLMKMKFIHQLAFEHERYKAGKLQRSKAWAIYFRRKTPDLTQAIDESFEYFPQIDPKAKFDGKDGHNIWTFPSCAGAKFQFAHMQHETDRFKYKSSAYCVAKGTEVVMADGSLKAIESVVSGDMVMTIEGARRVTATWDTGVKPCVRVTTRFRGEIVGRQLHPTTHPVLVPTIYGSPPSRWRHIRQSADLTRPLALGWQDFESYLDGVLVSQEIRASRVGPESCFAASDGSRQDLTRLAPSSCPVVLHGPSARSALSRESGTCAPLSEPLPRTHREPRQPLCTTSYYLPPELGDERSGPRYSDGLPGVYDDVGERTGLGRPIDWTANCSSSDGPHDERVRREEAQSRAHVLQQADAAGRSPIYSQLSGWAGIQTDNQNAPSFYPHFYTEEQREVREPLLCGEMDVEFAGWFETFDLTVDGANHYISGAGIINCQTYLAFDELTEFEEIQFLYMQSRLRCADEALIPFLQVVAGSNPDGPGLLWVRNRFIENRQPNRVYRTLYHLDNGMTKAKDEIFIPFGLKDNPVLYNSGAYEMQLRGLPPEIREAILEGNWYYASGAFLARLWNTKFHVVDDHPVPTGVTIYRSGDYGYNKPSSITWWYVDRDGILTAFYNLYVTQKTPEQLADCIKEVEQEFGLWDEDKDLSTISGPLDSACWNKQSSAVTIAARLASRGVRFYKAKKGPGSRKNGAIEIISRMEARLPDHEAPTVRARDKSMLRWMRRCAAPIRTIPILRSDPHNPDDVDTDGEDHCWDDTMYMCLARPMTPQKEHDEDEDEVDNVVNMPKKNRMW